MIMAFFEYLDEVTDPNRCTTNTTSRGAMCLVTGSIGAVFAFALLVLHIRAWPEHFASLPDSLFTILPNLILLTVGLVGLVLIVGGVNLVIHGRNTRR